MIVITQYPLVTKATHEEGELYEMVGENLDLLPEGLVATYTAGGDQASQPSNLVWPLDHVNDDATKAYFRQTVTHNYGSEHTLNRLLTPSEPPRTRWYPPANRSQVRLSTYIDE